MTLARRWLSSWKQVRPPSRPHPSITKESQRVISTEENESCANGGCTSGHSVSKTPWRQRARYGRHVPPCLAIKGPSIVHDYRPCPPTEHDHPIHTVIHHVVRLPRRTPLNWPAY